jgi:uncharacterized SAM-binding protein YcdF (DUF218 family)
MGVSVMLMDLRYFLKGMLLPPFTQILMLLFAWKIRHTATKVSRTISFIALLSLWLLASPVVATFLAQTLEQEPPLRPNQLSSIHGDAIVILSGYQDEYAPEFGEPVSGDDQLARVRYGAFLQKKTGLPVLLSGGSVGGEEQRSLAETMAFDLVSGYGGKVDWLEMRSRTTAENALYCYKLLTLEDKTTILLVTNSMHMMRAKWSFEQAGFKVVAAPTHFVDRGSLNLNFFFPTASALHLSSEAMHEWLGYWVYKCLSHINPTP